MRRREAVRRVRALLAQLAFMVVFAVGGVAAAQPSVTGVRIGAHPDSTRFVLDLSENIHDNGKDEVSAADLPRFNETGEPPSSSYRFPSFKDATDAYQREFIIHKLNEFDGNVSKAAESMGVDRTHLYRKMRNLGIERGE